MTVTPATAATAANAVTVLDVPVLTLANVKKLGSDDNYRNATARRVVDAMPADYVWDGKINRGGVGRAILATMGLDAHPEAQKVKGKETVYGIGHRVLANAVSNLVKADAAATDPVMRVSLTGTGSAVVPADHPAYALLMALLAGE